MGRPPGARMRNTTKDPAVIALRKRYGLPLTQREWPHHSEPEATQRIEIPIGALRGIPASPAFKERDEDLDILRAFELAWRSGYREENPEYVNRYARYQKQRSYRRLHWKGKEDLMPETAIVHIERGEHQHPVPPQTDKFVASQLEARGVTGTFSLRWGPKIQGSVHSPKFKSFGVTDRANVEVVVKPGDNGTAHVCWITPENGTAITLDELHRRLSLAPAQAQPEANGKPAPAGAFTDKKENVIAFLRLLAAHGGHYEIGDLRQDATAALGPRSDRAWGLIVSALHRRRLVRMTQNGHGSILSVDLTDHGRTMLPESMRNIAPPPPEPAPAPANPLDVFHETIADPPEAVEPGGELMDTLQTFAKRLAEQEDALTMHVLELEEAVERERKSLRDHEEMLRARRAELDRIMAQRKAAEILTRH